MRARPVIRAIVGCRSTFRALALAAGLTWAGGAARGEAATAHVQYLSSSSVYLDIGRAAGLAEGASVRVEREGRVIAELVVEFVAQSSAACKIVSSTAEVRPGDVCTFTAAQPEKPPSEGPAGPAAAGAAGAAGAAATPPAKSTPRAGTSAWFNPAALKGSITMFLRQSGAQDGTLTNPALRADVRWRGANRQEFGMRLRADRPRLNLDSGISTGSRAAQNLRLYEAEMRYRGVGEKLEMSAGRFIPSRLELMGYLDGGALSYRATPMLRLGVTGGRGAVLGAGGFQANGSKLGGYIEATDPRRSGPMRWRAFIGAARLEDPDVTRRQFVSLRGDERLGSRLRVYEYCEVDVNPGWKRVLGEPHVDFTSWSLGTQIEAHRRIDFTVNVDSRRDLLLPEQRHAPAGSLRLETTRGAYGSVHLQLARWTSLRFGGDFRKRSDGTRTTRAWDASLYGGHPALPNLNGALHVNIYDAAPGRGELYDADLGYRATSWLRLDVAAGLQHSRGVSGIAGASNDLRSNWVRTGADIQAPGGLWLGGTSEWRSDPRTRDLFLELGYRF